MSRDSYARLDRDPTMLRTQQELRDEFARQLSQSISKPGGLSFSSVMDSKHGFSVMLSWHYNAEALG